MKIHDIGSSKPVAGPRRKTEASGRGDDFARELRDVADSGGQAPSVDGVSSVGSLLSVQEVPDSTEGRSRGLARRYGDDILDRLDRIRHQILSGAVSCDQLADLARTLRAKRVVSEDPKLNEIIEEIELRAEVEIAKLSRDV